MNVELSVLDPPILELQLIAILAHRALDTIVKTGTAAKMTGFNALGRMPFWQFERNMSASDDTLACYLNIDTNNISGGTNGK